MRFSPVLVFHICSGVLGLLSGAASMIFRKGSRRHRLAGDAFVISMLGLGASGAAMGFMRHEAVNVAMGILACYLVTTAWRTARRGGEGAGIFDWGALMVPLAVGATLVINGVQGLRGLPGLTKGVPVPMYFILGSIALLFAGGDVRMIVRGGVSGAQRVARHLVRMCFALFIAAASLFLARPHLFPAILRKTGALVLLGFLPLILMIFWLVRVRVTKRFAAKSIPARGDLYSLPA
jgi:uncharacterized membrane protein